MKPALMRRVLAATLVVIPAVISFAHADDKPTRQQPLVLRAMTAASHEMQAAMEDGASLNKNFEKLINFQHSPDTVKLLVEAFGTDRPWSMEKRGIEQGKTAWHWRLNPLHQGTADGGTLVWSELPVDLWVDKPGKAVDFRGAWPSLSYEDKDARISLHDGTLSGTQYRGAGNIWYGSMQGGFGSMQVEGKAKPLALSMRELSFSGKMEERPSTVQMTQSFGIKAIEFAGERVDDFTVAMRFVNIEKAALVAMQATQKKLSAKQAASRDDLSAMMPMFKSFLRGATRHKTALVIDEMSFAFHGHKAMLSGRVGIDGTAGANTGDMAALSKRINARFEIKVLVALVREVALAAARQQASRADNAQAKAVLAAPEASAQNVSDAIIGKLLGNGYARLENDMLVSTIEFRGGVLRVNGKKIDLPAPGKGPAPAKAANFMQARRISDSCTLPEYPQDVVEKDAALTLTLQFVVNPAGQLRDLKLAEASSHPEYDTAVLAAFAGCRFIPALRDGKPVEHTLTHTLSREPGSARP
ncbi:DUF945 family protein [Massilia niabensis]|uniref:DUF945 family protein n=1 Tax=Massilia niabensis TaxID=544910 RepID=A0ABW0KZH3_9BURK